MFVLSNEKEDQWGKYFHLGELRKYVFPIRNYYDTTKHQKSQIKKALKKTSLIPLIPELYNHLNLTYDEKEMLDVTMKDLEFDLDVRVIRPYWILTDNFDEYTQKFPDCYFGCQFNPISAEIEILYQSLNNYQRGQFATGYTDFTQPMDGIAILATGLIELENGDFLVNILWEWFNK